MKFTTVLAIVAGAAGALAHPYLTPRASRMSERRNVTRSARRTLPKIPATGTTNLTAMELESPGSNVQYSQNWAGAVLVGSDYKTVKGTFTVPTPKAPSGSSSNKAYAASAWVGIDGDTCESAILQAGVDFNVQGGEVSYDAWYEWYPQDAFNFDNFDISAGDEITVTIAADSTTSGKVTIDNKSTGKSVSHSFNGEGAALCETNAEWIVEDFEEGDSLVPFADFGTVSFTDCSPSLSGASVIDIKQSSTVKTSCSISGTSKVTCSYA